MQLVTGMRVTLEVHHGDTYVAVVRAVSDNWIDVDVLDELDFAEVSGRSVNIISAGPHGLEFWQASVSSPVREGYLTLVLSGVNHVTQRRRHDRHAVAVAGEIRRTLLSASRAVDVVDLSFGGAKVVGDVSLMTGDRTILGVDLDGESIQVPVQVVMSYPDNNGRRVCHLAFAHPNEPSPGIDAIARFLATQSA